MQQSLRIVGLQIEIPGRGAISVNGQILPTEIVMLRGESGCGKTTLLRALSGLHPVLAGECFLGEAPLLGRAPADLRVGFALQKPAFFSHLNVNQNLIFPLRYQKKFQRWNESLMLERAQLYLSAGGLGDLAERAVDGLSGGERQRLSLLRALIWEPDYLLLDEAFSAVDLERKISLQNWLLKRLQERPLPTLAISHDLGDAERLGARVVEWSKELKI